MPLLRSQIDQQGMGTIAVVGLFALSALAFAADSYVKWLPNAVAAVSRNSTALPSDLNPAGQTGCPLGKKSLPTQLTPLP
jgi:hypothetical protein